MIKIAHRGNINGPIFGRENSPEYLLEAIVQGYEVEVDLWMIKEKPWFGHDEPQYAVSQTDFIKISPKAWFHCKNLEAMEYLAPLSKYLRYFWHQEDDYAIVSNGDIWTHTGRPTSKTSVVVDIDLKSKIDYDNVLGVCTDYPSRLGG
jgi:hypothetical protein